MPIESMLSNPRIKNFFIITLVFFVSSSNVLLSHSNPFFSLFPLLLMPIFSSSSPLHIFCLSLFSKAFFPLFICKNRQSIVSFQKKSVKCSLCSTNTCSIHRYRSIDVFLSCLLPYHGNFLLGMLPCYGNKCFFVFLIKLTIIRLFCLFLHTDKR